MAQLPNGPFNQNSVAAATPFEPVPAGWYNVVIEGSEMKPTNDKSGQYLELTMRILDGELVNRKIWDRLNLQNKSEKAMEIAYGNLSAICKAVNIATLQDSTELHNKPLRVRVKLKPAEGKFAESNDVSGYGPIEGVVNSAAPSSIAPTAAPAAETEEPAPAATETPAAAATPPWKKKPGQ